MIIEITKIADLDRWTFLQQSGMDRIQAAA